MRASEADAFEAERALCFTSWPRVPAQGKVGGEAGEEDGEWSSPNTVLTSGGSGGGFFWNLLEARF